MPDVEDFFGIVRFVNRFPSLDREDGIADFIDVQTILRYLSGQLEEESLAAVERARQWRMPGADQAVALGYEPDRRHAQRHYTRLADLVQRRRDEQQAGQPSDRLGGRPDREISGERTAEDRLETWATEHLQELVNSVRMLGRHRDALVADEETRMLLEDLVEAANTVETRWERRRLVAMLREVVTWIGEELPIPLDEVQREARAAYLVAVRLAEKANTVQLRRSVHEL